MRAPRFAPDTRSRITVASGIPRSGTSLVMQMLEAAGLPILCDDARSPDSFNPHGYYELEAVKATARDTSWIEGAPGHAVKVISTLLPALPREYPYRVILIERDLAEVVASQARMLGSRESRIGEQRLIEIFAAQREETRALLDREDHFEWIAVQHADLLRHPACVAKALAAFLELPQAAEEMAAVVAPGLYRERMATGAQA